MIAKTHTVSHSWGPQKGQGTYKTENAKVAKKNS